LGGDEFTFGELKADALGEEKEFNYSESSYNSCGGLERELKEESYFKFYFHSDLLRLR
jgi:hypothetical protein